MEQDNDDVAITTLDSPVGVLSVAVSRIGLLGVRWGDPDGLVARAALPVVDDPKRTAPVREAFHRYFAGESHEFPFALDWRLAPVSHQPVLRTLFDTVRFGDSVTYGELANRSGSGIPARGIGTVMGRNPLPLVVPCHRVLAHDGLGGYSGGGGLDGLEVKRWLLTHEGAVPPTLDWDPAGPARFAR